MTRKIWAAAEIAELLRRERERCATEAAEHGQQWAATKIRNLPDEVLK